MKLLSGQIKVQSVILYPLFSLSLFIDQIDVKKKMETKVVLKCDVILMNFNFLLR